MGTNRPVVETLELRWAACHSSALDIDDRGENPQFLGCSAVDLGQSYISCCSLSQNLIVS